MHFPLCDTRICVAKMISYIFEIKNILCVGILHKTSINTLQFVLVMLQNLKKKKIA